MSSVLPANVPSIVEGTQGSQHRIQKRARVAVSCIQCRARKLKCNREHPCDSCISRASIDNCSYATSGVSNNGVEKSVRVQKKPDAVQQRLDRLEGLVTALISDNSGSTPSDGTVSTEASIEIPGKRPSSRATHMAASGLEGNLEQSVKALGAMKVSDDSSVYRGRTHWDDVLQEIAAMKNAPEQYLEENLEYPMKETSGESLTAKGPTILLGLPGPPSKEELLSSLPSKSAADKLVSRFFNAFDPTIPALQVLHEPTFMKQYEEHWRKPSSTKIIWLGLLFSILCLTLQSYVGDEEEPTEYRGVSQALADLYRTRTAQCLMSTDLGQSAPYTIETMLFKSLADYARIRDTEADFWMTVGTIVRAAMRMGLHRDAARHPKIMPFQAEMRRRVWAFIFQADSLLSFHIGLPSMCRSVNSDSAAPSNLYDIDLHEGMTKVPQPRPPSEPTPISYMIAKNHLFRALGNVVEHLSSLQPESYNEVIHLDNELEEARAMIPPHLKLRGWEDSKRDNIYLIMQRLHLDFLYHQGLIVLHRRFLGQARTNLKFATSRERCVDSSMALLAHQAALHKESIFCGRAKSQWYCIPSLSADFSLAAMILCLDLQHGKDQCSMKGLPTPADESHRRDVLQALSISCDIWRENQGRSKEARRVYRVLADLLRLLRLEDAPSYGTNVFEASLPAPPKTEASLYVTTVPPEVPSVTFIPEIPNSTSSGPQDYSLIGTSNVNGDLSFPTDMPAAELSAEPFDLPQDFDWNMLDSFVQGADFGDDYKGLAPDPVGLFEDVEMESSNDAKSF